MIFKFIFINLITLSLLGAITNSIYDVGRYLDRKNFYFSGKFYYYDFDGSPAHYDFAYEAYTGEILQLRGKNSTVDDLFGWKEIDIVLPSNPLYYFLYLGDFDEDGDSRFDWVLVHLDKKVAYKLIGKSLSDTFVWSENIPVSVNVEGDFVAFEKTFEEEETMQTDNTQTNTQTEASTEPLTEDTSSVQTNTENVPNIPPTIDDGDMPPVPSF